MPAIGDEVVIQWMDLSNGGVSRESGRLNVVMSGDRITELVVESDGGATFIPRALVISVDAA